MKKTKTAHRIENAVNAFFETGDTRDKANLSYSNAGSFAADVPDNRFTQKADRWFAVFKQTFLFLPGTVALFFLTVAVFGLFSPENFRFIDLGLVFGLLLWFSLGGSMVWLGLGSLKKGKHVLLPLSVIAASLAVAAAVSLFAGSISINILMDYAIYCFPFIITTPVLVRDYLSEK